MSTPNPQYYNQDGCGMPPPQMNNCPPEPCPPNPCPPRTKHKLHIGMGHFSRRCDEDVPTYNNNPCPPPRRICNDMDNQQNIGASMDYNQTPGNPQYEEDYSQEDVVSAKSNSTSEDLGMASPELRKVRTIVICFSTSLAEASRNPCSASWVLKDENILKKRVESVIGAKRCGDLSKVIPISIHVKQVRSNAPVPLMASSEQIRGNTYSNYGRGFLTILPGTAVHEGPEGYGQLVYLAQKMVTLASIKTYGGKSIGKLKEDLTYVSSGDFYLVPMEHEIIRILEAHPGSLKSPINQSTVVQGHFMVEGDLARRCLQEIERQVHDLKAWTDMRQGKFKINLLPVSGSWTDLKYIESVDDSPEYVSSLLEKKFTVTFTARIDYSILDDRFTNKK